MVFVAYFVISAGVNAGIAVGFLLLVLLFGMVKKGFVIGCEFFDVEVVAIKSSSE